LGFIPSRYCGLFVQSCARSYGCYRPAFSGYATVSRNALSTHDREAEDIDDYHALFWRRPGLAGVFTLMLLSLAGIPVTAGFIGKFYIVAAGASSAMWALVIILVVSSVIGLFYYLRIVAAMYASPERDAIETGSRISAPAGAVLYMLAVLLVWFGIYPEPLLRLIRTVLRA
jgi:NADH-quinone oxidoreductase subunit N